MSYESALLAHGLIGPFNPDGALHRCATRTKPRSTNGWYVVHAGGKAVTYGDWANGGDESITWEGEKLTAKDRAQIKTKGEELRDMRRAEQLKLADEAVEFYEQAQRTGYSDYLKVKQVDQHGLRFDGTTLIMPLQDATGKVWSYQKIYANGAKYFMPGGKVQGCYYLITAGPIADSDRVIICEGYATGASIHAATALPVVVALNAGNLKTVADSLPFTNLLIAADNDENKVGEKAAEASGYPYVMPDVEGWDFNDVATHGKDVKRYFIAESTVALTQGGAIAVHGLVGEIADWITATAIKPQPMLSLAAALSFVAMLKGHRVAGYTNLRTNLLVLSLAPTAAGKEHPQNCIKRLATACDLDKHMMGEPVSGGGFLTGLNKANRVGLLVMDELGRFLANIASKNAGNHQREIVDYIIKTFSCANSTLKGRQYVDEKKNPTIDVEQPHFCCLGSTVPEKMLEACGSSDVIDGFLNRWIVFNVKERVPRNQKVKHLEPSTELVAQIKGYMAEQPYDQYGKPTPREVRFTPEAWEYFTKYRDGVDQLIEQAAYPLDRLYARSCEHIEKVALTLSDGEDVLITDVRAAIAIVEQSNASIMEFAGMISDNIYEQDYVRVREIIREAGEIRRNVLTRRTQFIQGGERRRAEILSALVDDNLIASPPTGGSNGKLITYKWLSK